MKRKSIFIISLLFLFSGCAEPETATPQLAATSKPTATPETTATPEPTASLQPPTKTIEPPTLNALEIVLTDQALTMESATPIPTITQPAPCGIAEEGCLELTFSGDSCTYEGPNKITPGQVRFIFHNDSEVNAMAWFLLLPEGGTAEDMVAWFSGAEAKRWNGPPPWGQSVVDPNLPAGETGGWEILLGPGNYYLMCREPIVADVVTIFMLWQGAGVTVEE